MCFYNNIPQKREEPSTYNTKSRICTLCKQWPVSGSWEVTFHTRNFPGDKTVIPGGPEEFVLRGGLTQGLARTGGPAGD